MEERSATGSGRSYAVKAVVAMCLMYVVITGIMWNTMTLYASPVSAEWGVNVTQFMVGVSIMGLTNAMIATFLYGFIQSRLSIRTMLLGGTALTVVGLLLFAFSNSLAMFYIATFLIGVGISPLNANTAYIVLGAWFKKSSSSKVGLATTCGSAAGIAATALYGFLIARLGWHVPLWITIGCVIVLFVLFIPLYRGAPADLGVRGPEDETDAAADEAAAGTAEVLTGGTVGEMFKSIRFYMLLVGYILVGLGFCGAFYNLAPFSTSIGYGELSGTVYSVALVGSTLTMFLGGKIVDRFGSKTFVLICAIAAVLGMYLLTIDNLSLAVLYIAAAILGLGYNATMVCPGISVREVFGTRDYGKKVGIIVGPCFAGLSLAPTVLSAVMTSMGSYQQAFLVFIIIAIVGCALTFAACAGAKYARKH